MTKPYWTQTETPWGSLWVNKNDMYVGASLMTYGEFSPNEWRWLCDRVKPGDVVLDIGANVGALTWPLAEAVGHTGHVIAIEPQPDVVDLLHANLLARTSRAPVTVLAKAAGAEAGTIHIPDVNYAERGNFGGVEFGGPSGTEVEVITVDSLELPSLQLLKADVEGMEPEVVRGARETIQRCRPLLYLESDRVNRRDELLMLITDLGYRVKYHMPPLYGPHNYRGLQVPLAHLVHTNNNLEQLVPVVERMVANQPPKLAEQLIEVISAASRQEQPVVSINVVGIPNEWPEQEWEK